MRFNVCLTGADTVTPVRLKGSQLECMQGLKGVTAGERGPGVPFLTTCCCLKSMCVGLWGILGCCHFPGWKVIFLESLGLL